MKKQTLIPIIAIAFAIASCSPMKHVSTSHNDPFEFSVIDNLSASKEDIYMRAWEWVARFFGDSKHVIRMQDKDYGKLIGKGTFSTYYGDIRYILSISVKDGRYLAKIDGFYGEGALSRYGNFQAERSVRYSPSSGKFTDRKYYYLKDQITKKSTSLLMSLQEKMQEPQEDF